MMTEQEKNELKDAVIAELKSQGTDVSTATVITDAEGISYVICYDTYGNIARVDLKTLNEKSGIDMSWDSNLNLDDIIVEGVYNIKGNRLNSDKDNLPFDNTGENASFAARLIVTTSPEGATVYRHIVGQTLIIANAEGHETNVYTRSGNRTSYDGGISYVTTWGIWSTLQKNTNVGLVTSLDDFIDNGIYSGAYIGTGNKFTFVMVVINDYALAEKLGADRVVNQFLYAVEVGGIARYTTRKKIGYAPWGYEEIIHEAEIASMIEDKINNIPLSTTENDGLMSAEDKNKLDSLTSGGGSGGGGDITAVPTDVVIEKIEPNLVSTAIRKTPQVLTDSEKEIARENIGAVSYIQLTSAINNAITETLNTAV